MHGGTVGVGDADGSFGHLDIVHRCAKWEEMRGAACVADGSKSCFAAAMFMWGTYE